MNYFLLLYFCFKNLNLFGGQATVRFFSENFVCHFYFLWPKIMCNVFTPKTICCFRSFSNFYRFYFWLRIFHCLYFGKIFLTIHFIHFDFIALCCLDFNSSNLFERSSIRNFWVYFCLNSLMNVNSFLNLS